VRASMEWMSVPGRGRATLTLALDQAGGIREHCAIEADIRMSLERVEDRGLEALPTVLRPAGRAAGIRYSFADVEAMS
jgi:hypothetical protein